MIFFICVSTILTDLIRNLIILQEKQQKIIRYCLGNTLQMLTRLEKNRITPISEMHSSAYLNYKLKFSGKVVLLFYCCFALYT